MNVWVSMKNATIPARSWLKRRWAPTAAAAAVIATTLGVITDLDSLITGGGGLSPTEASALAANVAIQLEARSVARGGDYGGDSDLERVIDQLAVSGERQIERALAEMETDPRAGLDRIEETASRLMRRDPGSAAQRYFAIGVLAEAVDPERAVAAYRQSLELMPDSSRTIDRLGSVYLEQGRDEEAETLHLQALELARTAGDEGEESIILGSLGAVYWRRGEYETASDYYGQALEVADLNGDLFRAARHLGNRGLMASTLGDLDAAEQYYERAISLMAELDDQIGIALARNNLGNLYRDRGELDRAEDAYRRAQAALEAGGHPQQAALTLANLGTIAESRGEFETAARFYERSLERAREYNYMRAIESAARNAGWMAMRRNDFIAARRFADEALAASEVSPDPASLADSLFLSVGVAASIGDDALARTHADRAFAIIEDRDVPPDTHAFLHDALALSAYQVGDLAEAERRAGRALEFYEAAGLPMNMAEQQLRLGSLALGGGRQDEGCAFLEQAEINFGRSGFIAEANRMVERREAEGCPAREIGGNVEPVDPG
ncbi:tetratricopeptide repeat protein [Hyphobacterium sp. HN65]|uniref:Tetratricopeptide repeat protein n=1 Tax=Hyphobacterium lacteum TaxID=3116575 RepID=A0ABU7LSF7_9PROT|nr:tetratricopeptide repeat protein [Hyphobacterium sp. HN65]MEE2526576.1 tetratricopeptide repeat protein [Hyphobacterium sp. HN65]